MSKQFRPRGIEADGLKYYQERDKAGDYVSVSPVTSKYYDQIGFHGRLEGRATAIKGQVSSVCTTALSENWLRSHCRRVRKSDIPKEWLEVL